MPPLADQVEQRVVHAHAQQVVQLGVSASVRDGFDHGGHGLFEGAGLAEAGVSVEPEPPLVEVGDVREGVVAPAVGVARTVAHRSEVSKQAAPGPSLEPRFERLHVEHRRAPEDPAQSIEIPRHDASGNGKTRTILYKPS